MAENKKNSPAKFSIFGLGLAASQAVVAGGALAGLLGIRSLRRGARRRQAELKRAQEEFDKRLQTYEESEFQELDPDQYRQENVFEDVTVDMEAVDYSAEQFKQQQANIMNVYRGVAGSSGIGALAQSLSNQAAKQARESQVYISKQLAENKKLRLVEQSRLQEQQRQIEINNAIGRRQFEADKMATLIGVAGQKVAGVNQRIANAQAMTGQIIGGLSQIAASAVTPTGS